MLAAAQFDVFLTTDQNIEFQQNFLHFPLQFWSWSQGAIE